MSRVPISPAEPAAATAQPPSREAFVAEVLRLNKRFITEVVEAFDFCPYSRVARRRGEVVRGVVLGAHGHVEPMLEELDRLTSGRPEVAVAIVILPLGERDPRAFDQFVQAVRAIDQQRHGGRPDFAAAAFHPEYRAGGQTPEQLIPFLRRSPDPFIQFVRLALLDELRGQGRGTFHFDFSLGSWNELMRRLREVSVTERIAQDNFDRVGRVGRNAIEEILDDICRDRRESYARFATLFADLEHGFSQP